MAKGSVATVVHMITSCRTLALSFGTFGVGVRSLLSVNMRCKVNVIPKASKIALIFDITKRKYLRLHCCSWQHVVAAKAR